MEVSHIGHAAADCHFSKSHTHDAWEIILNLQGRGHTVIGGRRYDYDAGSIICCPPLIPHEKYSTDGFKDIFLVSPDFVLAKGSRAAGVLLFKDDINRSFEQLLCIAHRAFNRQGHYDKGLVSALWEAMQQLLLGWAGSVHDEECIARIKNRIVENFADPEFSVNDALDGLAYSKDHLRKKFKAATGHTVGEYLTVTRIEHAKKLLLQNHFLHYTISEIGAMSGYYDSHYFSRVFKGQTGQPPNDFYG